MCPWVAQAISDDDGRADMAYLSIGLLSLAAVASLAFIFTMSAISYANCHPITTISKGEQSTTSVIPCNFDPLPIGQSAGLIFGAFGALIASLAGYMAATRRSGAKVAPAAPVPVVEPAPTWVVTPAVATSKPKPKPKRRR